MIKHHHKSMTSTGNIEPTTAPSYMLESAALSMPSSLFTGDPATDLENYIDFMKRAIAGDTAAQLVHGNGLHPLVGNNPNTQWGLIDAKMYVNQLVESTS